jgi:hypothetical protein
LNWIFSTKARTFGAGIVGFVTTAAAAVGILYSVGVFDNSAPRSSIINNIDNRTINQYYGSLATPPDSGPSQPASNSNCTARGMGTIGQGEVYVTLTEKFSLSSCWSQYLAPVIPGSTVRLLISYRNLSHFVQRNVVVRVELPAGFQVMPNTTSLYNSNYPKGLYVTDNDLSEGGDEIGSYYPGAAAYVTFYLAVPFGDNVSCGWTDFQPTVIAQPNGMAEFSNRAELEVARQC